MRGRDTEAPPVSVLEPRTRSGSSDPLLLISRKRGIIISPKLLALILAGPVGLGGYSLWEARGASAQATEAVEIGQEGAALARTAKTVAVDRYKDIKEKLDPTAQLAASATASCITREEFEEQVRRIDRLQGRRQARENKPARPEVPAEVTTPLPAPPRDPTGQLE